jgi:hypothetical protein
VTLNFTPLYVVSAEVKIHQDREKNRRYREKMRDKVKLSKQLYREKNKEGINISKRLYRKQKEEKVKVSNSLY